MIAKKTTFLCTLAAGLLVFNSCNKGGEEPTNYQTITLPTINLVSKTDGSYSQGSVASYTFNLDYAKSTVSATTKTLALGDNKVEFTTSTGTLDQKAYVAEDGSTALVLSFNGLTATTDNAAYAVTDFSGSLQTGFYHVYNMQNPGIATTPIGTMTVLKYNIGDYSVRTLPADICYLGSTRTSYQTGDGEGSFTTESIVYRVVIDAAKSKAHVCLYNAKFASNMPVSVNIILQDLDVEWKMNRYEITGTDIVPQSIEAGGLTPMPPFKFDSFHLSTTDDYLTSVSINYSVAGKYQGTFAGSYLSVKK